MSAKALSGRHPPKNGAGGSYKDLFLTSSPVPQLLVQDMKLFKTVWFGFPGI